MLRRLIGGATCGLCAVLLATSALAQSTPGAGAGGAGSTAGSGAGGATGTGSGGASAATGPRSSALRVGTLGFPVGADSLMVGAPQRAWTLRPSIALDLIATDNVRLTARNRQSDFITALTPSIVATADTARLQGSLSYRPIGYLYAGNPDQNRIDHFLDGQALATLVEDRFFLDIRAASSVAALTGGFGGGFGGGYAPVLDRLDRVQTTTFLASPYLQFRFGGLGILQVGYAFQYVDQSRGGNGFGGGGPAFGGLGATGFFAAGDYIAHEGFAAFRTGEDLGRLAFNARISATEYDGSGVLDGASRRYGIVEGSYALTRSLSALLDLGYEQQRYGGPVPLELDSPIWGAGLRLAGPESHVTAKYGRRDGFESAFLDASVAIGGRTTLGARYEERLTTATQLAAARLAASRLDQFGNRVDPITGIPLVPTGTDSLLASQGGLFRTRSAGLSLTQVWDRDTVTLSLGRDERRPVNARGPVFAQTGTSVSLSWVRQLSPDVAGSVFGSYGRTESRVRGDGTSYSAGVSLSRDFGQGLSGSVQYRHTNRDDLFLTGRAVQNLVLVGVRKDFW